MLANIIQIAILCIAIGGASIPVSFAINSNPVVVWVGNALGSLISAAVVIYIGNRITDKKFEEKVSKRRLGKKVVTVFTQDKSEDKKVEKIQVIVDKHGLRLFALICPVFPGVLVSTAAVYLLGLDKKLYKKYMLIGVFLTSGFYVLSYWWVFVK